MRGIFCNIIVPAIDCSHNVPVIFSSTCSQIQSSLAHSGFGRLQNRLNPFCPILTTKEKVSTILVSNCVIGGNTACTTTLLVLVAKTNGSVSVSLLAKPFHIEGVI